MSTLDLRSHRNLRGPYTAGGELLRHVVPELMSADPALTKPAATAIAAIAPDLEGELPFRPQTLTDQAQGEERTRLYPSQRTRYLAFMVSELVKVWAQACHPEGVTLRFWELAEADPTDVQLFAMLQRRCDPSSVGIVDAGPAVPPGRGGTSPDPAQRYIDADGTSKEPAERAAYAELAEPDRRARHTQRAHLLAEQAQPGTQLGAVPYHLERGEDPNEAVPWLVAAVNQVIREAFYDAAVDLGIRGRTLVPWAQDATTHNHLTRRIIGALTSLVRCDEAMELIQEHRCTTIEPAEQLHDAYMMAMMYTRHLDPARRDRDQALAWANTAIALAEASAPDKRAFPAAFTRNARALVEMHRGNLTGSLDLVNEAIEIMDEHLDPDSFALHRTVLVTNRGRVLLALKDYDGAIRSCDEVVNLDPEYYDPYFDRSTAHRARGDLEGALRDLDHAIELNVAFADAYYNRADIRLEFGEEALAMADLDAALDVDPDHVFALLSRGALLLAAGDLDAAETDIARGLSVSPGHAHLWSAKGLLRGEQGSDTEALECYATALELDPTLVEVHANRAVLHFIAGRVAAAIADLDQAIALSDVAALRVNRGIALHDLGDHEAAIRDYDAALAMPDADVATVLYRRGLSRHALGQHALASADWDLHLQAAAGQGEVSEYADEIAELKAGQNQTVDRG
ncbi:MAG TPA: tetratricopeptide repeat protein [Streptosporangiaceae bacterium]|jgi:tetratricopeptide (TPR) repeat protein